MVFDQSMHKDLVIIDHLIQYPKTYCFKKNVQTRKNKVNQDLKEEAEVSIMHIYQKKNVKDHHNTSIGKIFFDLTFFSREWYTIDP
jgi:hypothetical protein